MSSDADVAGIGAVAEENGAFFLDTEPEAAACADTPDADDGYNHTPEERGDEELGEAGIKTSGDWKFDTPAPSVGKDVPNSRFSDRIASEYRELITRIKLKYRVDTLKGYLFR